MSETQVAVSSPPQKMSEALAVSLASRKFILVMFFSVAATIGMFTEHMTAQEYLTAMGMLVGIYITGNVTQRIKTSS